MQQFAPEREEEEGGGVDVLRYGCGGTHKSAFH